MRLVQIAPIILRVQQSEISITKNHINIKNTGSQSSSSERTVMRNLLKIADGWKNAYGKLET